ncbi:flavodoxin family protein [Kocuria sp. M1R5S2]|uniref:flavodoxin family protein n=1 Tax=Kocuria rhizosphaerae TaxID=3376285 RepID=UPI00379853B8
MTVVVVYESMYGNTHRIAEAIGRGLTEAGAPVEVISVDAVRERGLSPEDVLVVGAPTHVHGLSRTSTREAAVHDAPAHGLEVDPSAQGESVREWLGTLDTHGGRAAAFDTRAKGPAVLTGRASQAIAKTLRRHGFELVTEPESFLVTSTNQLLPEEEARAHQWGAGLATTI